MEQSDKAASSEETRDRQEIEASPLAASILETLRPPACLVDARGAVRLNAAWRSYAESIAIHGKTLQWSQLIHPDDREAALNYLEAASRAGAGCECRLLGSGQNAPRWFVMTLQELRENRDRPLWLCIATDIHELKRRAFDLEARTSIQADMLNISVDCIALIALDGTLVHMNEAGCRALGVAPGAYFGTPWLSLFPEGTSEDGRQAFAAAGAGALSRFSGRNALPGQPPRYWDNMLTPVLNADGRPSAILCISRDVTAERNALESLKESQERLAIAARVGGLGVWDYNIRTGALHCDEGWHRIMGRDPADPIRHIEAFRPIIHPDDVERATEVVQTAAELIGNRRDYSIVFRIVRPDGDIRWVRSAAYLQHEDDVPTRAVGFVVDITNARRGELALRKANRTLRTEKRTLARESLKDPLTGLANRRRLDMELARLCKKSREAPHPLCVGMIDVDHFKAFNDRYGHLEGDVALKKVAGALRSIARKSDLIARYGGEEFTLVLPASPDPGPMLDRLMATVAALAIPNAGASEGCLTISCGCVVLPPGGAMEPADLLKAADRALYEAKTAGRNRYVVHAIQRA